MGLGIDQRIRNLSIDLHLEMGLILASQKIHILDSLDSVHCVWNSVEINGFTCLVAMIPLPRNLPDAVMGF